MNAQITSKNKLGALLVFLSIAGFYIYALLVIPEYRQVFRDFGAIPPFTAWLVFETYPYWFVLVALGAIGGLQILRHRSRKGWFFVTPAFVTALLFAALTWVSVMAPVLNLQ